jgi:hypothetical protein
MPNCQNISEKNLFAVAMHLDIPTLQRLMFFCIENIPQIYRQKYHTILSFLVQILSFDSQF